MTPKRLVTDDPLPRAADSRQPKRSIHPSNPSEAVYQRSLAREAAVPADGQRRRQLAIEQSRWDAVVRAMARVLEPV